jgi:hypothetical protein
MQDDMSALVGKHVQLPTGNSCWRENTTSRHPGAAADLLVFNVLPNPSRCLEPASDHGVAIPRFLSLYLELGVLRSRLRNIRHHLEGNESGLATD